LFRSAFDNAPIGIGVSGLDGHYLRVNRALCEILGYSQEELQATTFQELTYPEDYEASMAHVDRLLAGELDRYSVEKRYVRADGRPVWVSLSVSLVRDPDNRPLYYVAQVQDITERKRAEETLREANRHLEKLAALRSDFTAMVAHEIGSPLASVRGFLEVLATGELEPADQADVLVKIRAEINRLGTLVADVRSAAAIERDDFALMTRPTAVDELLDDAARFAETLPGDHPLTIAAEVDGRVLADPYRIGQVLRNLLSNAVKYSPDGAPIELRARPGETPGRIGIEVADRGHGVHPDDVDQIFEKFGRGRDRSGRMAYGVGLGLYLSRRIVRAHGGEKLVVSFASTDNTVAREEPSGSTLTFQDGSDSGSSACGPSPSGSPPASSSDDETVAIKAVKRGTAEMSLSQSYTTNSGSGTFDYGPARFKVTVNNVAPTISVVSNQGTDEDDPTDAIPFTVGDAGTAADELAVSASSSNTTLVPNSNINLGGSGANRTVTVTPASNRFGTTDFAYTVSDGNGETDTATVTVNVAPTNDAPESNNDSYSVDEDGTLNIGAPGVLEDDTDLDDLLGPLTALTTVLVNGPDDGTLTLNPNGSFVYEPNANFNGTDSFTYRATDGTVNSNVATVMINVSAVNDAPGFDLQTNPNQTVSEDAGTQTVAGFATNASAGPANESSQTVSFAVTNDNHALFSGQPTISPSGTLTYTPASNANGTANVTVTATDNGGDNTSGERTFTITANAVNDVPTVTLSGAANASEGQTKTYGFTVTDPDPGGFTLNSSGFPDCGIGELVGAPTRTHTGGSFKCRFTDGPVGTTVRVRVSDLQGETSNIATRSLRVADVAPRLTLSGPTKVKQGQTATYTFAVTDPGTDTFGFAARYPSCGQGAVLVGRPSIGTGRFACWFVKAPARSTVAVRVGDLDGGFSNTASKTVNVAKTKK
jgi:PAS domain S-box-containing protein